MKKTALISVYDKSGIVEFAKDLKKLNWDIISSGGSARLLRENGVEVLEVADFTGFPEVFDGRVKTLNSKIYSGILYRRNNSDDVANVDEMKIKSIDMVVNSLYPFEEKLKSDNVEHDEMIENIDIGGVSMIRAAAKNYNDVYIVVDSADYGSVISNLKNDDMNFRLYLAKKAFSYTAYYDGIISQYFMKYFNDVDSNKYSTDSKFTDKYINSYFKIQDLRYGENPHQSAAFYERIPLDDENRASIEQLNGKELSYNNLVDTYSSVKIIKEFEMPTAVAVKHNNPCGIGSAGTLFEAFEKAYECDTESIFGGIVSFNRKLDLKSAELLSKIFLEIIIAPDYEDEALELLCKKKNLRILKIENLMNFKFEKIATKQVLNGILLQENNDAIYDELKVVTKRMPTSKEYENLKFAWKSCKHINSNGVVLAKNNSTIAIGSGEVKRFWAVEKSIHRAVSNLNDAVLASDGFFFPDTIEILHKHGVKAVIQPGGSIRDEEVIEMADKFDIAMVFTGMRHFKH